MNIAISSDLAGLVSKLSRDAGMSRSAYVRRALFRDIKRELAVHRDLDWEIDRAQTEAEEMDDVPPAGVILSYEGERIPVLEEAASGVVARADSAEFQGSWDSDRVLCRTSGKYLDWVDLPSESFITDSETGYVYYSKQWKIVKAEL